SSGNNWKAALNAAGDWYSPEADDAAWQNAISYAQEFSPQDPSGSQLGHPWMTGPVKILRHAFQVDSPVVSARLYATALGAYEFRINGRQVGDQILAPGWTDFRTRVFYQTYDVTGDIRT